MDRIHVMSRWKQGELTAYLYGFDIDSSNLQREHESFLSQMLADIWGEWGTRQARATDICHVWLLGTASRSGSWQHNSPLSRERAGAVRKFLERQLQNARHPVAFSNGGVSEVVAFLKGEHDGTEDPLDRSVLLVAKWHSLPNPRPPVVKRPEPINLPQPLFKKFLIRPRFSTSDALAMDKKGRVSIQHLSMELEIMDVYIAKTAIYEFEGAGPAIDFTPEKFQPPERAGGLPGVIGPWHKFTVPSGYGFPTRNCDDFAGGALFEDYSLLNKSWSGFYFDQSRRFPMKYGVAIRDFDTGIPAGWSVASGGAATGKMKLKLGARKL